MPSGPPYRPPCCPNPPPARCWHTQPRAAGSCYQHRRAAEAHLTHWENTTRVMDPDHPGDWIPPWPRRDDRTNWPSGGDCPGGGTDPTCTATPHLCGPWSDDEFASCPTPDTTHATVDLNCYHRTDTTDDHSACRKLGFKNVQARKSWHGRFGFLSHDTSADGRPDRKQDSIWFDPPCLCDLEFEQTSPDQTKYRTMTVETWAKWTLADDSTDEATAIIEHTVNRYSGVVTRTECSPAQPTTQAQLSAVSLRGAGVLIGYASALDVYNSVAYNADPDYEAVESRDGPDYHVEVHRIADDALIREADYNAETGDMTADWYDPDADPGQEHLRHEAFSFSNTTAHRELWEINTFYAAPSFAPAPPAWKKFEGSIDVTLSAPYTAAELYSDLVGLLACCPLDDDAAYPWRQDEFAMIAPLVTYNEVVGGVSPVTGMEAPCLDDEEEPWEDPNASFYDGSIRGIPNPAGYASHFDRRHRTWHACLDGEIHVPYIHSHGAWSNDANDSDSTDAFIPAAATQWTENFSDLAPVAGDLPCAGAWLWMPTGGGLLIAQKWAEIKIPRPSHNFARPSGTDRWLLDPSTARCIQDIASGTVSISSATDIDTGDYCAIVGWPSDQGIYQVTKSSPTSYALGTKIADLPTSYPNSGTGIFARLPWWTAPAFPGRIAISAATQSGPNVDLTLAEPAPAIRSGDLIDTDGLGSLGDALAVTVTDPTHLSVTGTLGSYAGGGYITAHAAAPWWWHDDQAKGDVVYATWRHSFRDYQERDRVIQQYADCADCPDAEPDDPTPLRTLQSTWGMPRSVAELSFTQDCLHFDVCNPQVLAISPNDEEFPHAILKPFGTFTADARYGSLWQAAFIQHVPDPFWQPPAKPCIQDDTLYRPTLCQLLMDDGSCAADTCPEDGDDPFLYLYYPHRPYVEALTGLPLDANGDPAPAPPSPISIGFASLDDIDSSSPPAKLVVPPPAALGYELPSGGLYVPTQPQTPWGIYIRQMYCTCGHGRFADDYQANGVRVHCP